MNKIIYLTAIPSPFQVEFIRYCNEISDRYHYQIVFKEPLPRHREHWGNNEGSHLYFKNNFKRFYNFLKAEKPSALILTQYNSLLNWTGLIYCILHNCPYFIGPVEKMNSYRKGLLIRKVRLWLFLLFSLQARAVFAIGKEAFKIYSKIYKGAVYEVAYPLDLTDLLNHLPRSFNHTSSKPLVFLFSGRLEKYRNPLLVIDAFGELLKDNKLSDVRLIISGKGSLEKECRRRIVELGIIDQVTWDNDYSSWKDLQNLYRKADVLVTCQLYSTWGLHIQEAMASGLGIIASPEVEAANSLIIHDYNGFLPANNKTQIIEHMKAYYESRKILALHGERSKRIIENRDKATLGRFLDQKLYELIK